MNKGWGSLICVSVILSAGLAHADPKVDRLKEVTSSDFWPEQRRTVTRMFISSLTPMLITAGDSIGPPSGHADYCRRYEYDCKQHEVMITPVVLTEDLLESIITLNRSVNSSITGVPDIYIYGKEEYWAYPTSGGGDCEDYALEKRMRLMELGVHASNLLLTTVWNSDTNSELADHTVLTVRTNKGDLVLDNLVPDVLPWQYVTHRFSARQTPYHAGRWELIHDIREDDELYAGVKQNQG